jgi:hypothetical protein
VNDAEAFNGDIEIKRHNTFVYAHIHTYTYILKYIYIY